MISIIKDIDCQEIQLDKKAEVLSVLFATAIVNPAGPTFHTYYVDSKEKGGSWKIYQVMVHPIIESITNVGVVIWNDRKDQIQEVKFYRDFFQRTMPTFFLKGSIMKNELFQELLKTYMLNSERAQYVYEMMSRYKDPIQRVSAEMKLGNDFSSQKILKRSKNVFLKLFNSNEVGTSGRGMNIDEFIKILTNGTNLAAEADALLMAYQGSINNMIPAKMVQVDFFTFLQIFNYVCTYCNFDVRSIDPMSSQNNSHVQTRTSPAQNHYNTGAELFKLKNFYGALAEFTTVIELDPTNSTAFLMRGNTKYHLNDFHGAISDYTKAISFEQDAESYLCRATAKYSIQAYQGVLDDYAKAIEIDPNWESNFITGTVEDVYFRRAFAKDALGDLKGAIKDYTKLIEVNPNSAGAYDNRGYAKHDLKDYQGAIDDFNKAIEIHPELDDAYLGRGLTKIAINQKDSGLLDINKAIELGSTEAIDTLKKLENH